MKFMMAVGAGATTVMMVEKQYSILNDWNQVFVDAVRAVGGSNSNRFLGVGVLYQCKRGEQLQTAD